MKILIKAKDITAFMLFYVYKLIEANLFMAYDVLTPKLKTNPGFIHIHLKTNTNFGLFMFSNLLSMTPGTLTVDISDDKSGILVHHLYGELKHEVLHEIEDMQQRIIKITNKNE